MKHQKGIIIGLILCIIIVVIFSLVCIKIRTDRIKQIKYINETYSAFINGKKINKNDKLGNVTYTVDT